MGIRAERAVGWGAEDGNRRGLERTRGCLARPSIVSREILLVVVLVSAAGSIFGMINDGVPIEQTSLKSLRGHDNLVENVVYAPDGQTLVSCGWDRHVRIWDVSGDGREAGRELASLPHSSHLFSVALTPDGKALGVAGVGSFSIWTNEANRGWELRAEHEGHSHRCVAAAPDSRTMAVGGEDGSIRLWDVGTGKQTDVLDGLHDDIRAVAFSPDGTMLVGCTFGGETRLWNLKSGCKPEPSTLKLGPADRIAMAPDNRTLVAASGCGHASVLTFWDLRSGQMRLRQAGSEAGNNVLVFSPDGSILVCADKDNSLRLRDARSGKVVATLSEGVGWVKTVAFSPDGRRLAFGGKDGSVQFRDLHLEHAVDLPGSS